MGSKIGTHAADRGSSTEVGCSVHREAKLQRNSLPYPSQGLISLGLENGWKTFAIALDRDLMLLCFPRAGFDPKPVICLCTVALFCFLLSSEITIHVPEYRFLEHSGLTDFNMVQTLHFVQLGLFVSEPRTVQY